MNADCQTGCGWPGRKDVCVVTGVTFDSHGPGPITHQDARKSTASLSKTWRRPVPTFCPLIQRKKEPDKTTEIKSMSVARQHLWEGSCVLFCVSFLGKSKKKKRLKLSLILALQGFGG